MTYGMPLGPGAAPFLHFLSTVLNSLKDRGVRLKGSWGGGAGVGLDRPCSCGICPHQSTCW